MPVAYNSPAMTLEEQDAVHAEMLVRYNRTKKLLVALREKRRLLGERFQRLSEILLGGEERGGASLESLKPLLDPGRRLRPDLREGLRRGIPAKNASENQTIKRGTACGGLWRSPCRQLRR